METALDVHSLFPSTNRGVAEALFVLEVGLREFIIETLSSLDGPKWYTRGLPADVAAKYLRGRLAERLSKWTTHIPHHPIYYIDFPDIEKVLAANWSRAFENTFSTKKEVFLVGLRSLEPIRNTVAHNRHAGPADLTIVEGVVAEFQSALGTDRLASLVARRTSISTLRESIGQLTADVDLGRSAMLALDPAPQLSYWPSVKNEWWFDSAYLTGTDHVAKLNAAESKLADAKLALARADADVAALRANRANLSRDDNTDVLEPVVAFFSLFDSFAALPRARGTGHRIEAWQKTHDVTGLAAKALDAIGALIMD